jgi:peptidoglycan LD-endopeptidase LytH
VAWRGVVAVAALAAVGAAVVMRPVTREDYESLGAGRLLIPVAGIRKEQLVDTFDQRRGPVPHEAIDILAPRGTAVLAVDDGHVEKLFNSKPGGLTIYQFDPTGTYCYYYAHLDRYAPGLQEKMAVRKGQRLGDVGSTGNASEDAPHLHFTIFKLGSDKRWWEGTPINPYPLWRQP